MCKSAGLDSRITQKQQRKNQMRKTAGERHMQSKLKALKDIAKTLQKAVSVLWKCKRGMK